MAQFCTKCGAPLAEGLKFCTGCGATQGGPSAPAAQAPAVQFPPPAAPRPAPVPPVAQGPVAPAVAAPAASSGSPIIKIILVVVAVIIFVSLLGAGACVYMVYRAKQKVTQFENKVQATFPMPTVPATAPTVPPSQETAAAIDIAGVPIYPGATAKEGTTELNMGGAGLKVRQFTTSDSVDKVVAFYKDKMGSQAMVTQNGQQALVQVVGSNGVVNVAIGSDSGSGITKITIQSISK